MGKTNISKTAAFLILIAGLSAQEPDKEVQEF